MFTLNIVSVSGEPIGLSEEVVSKLQEKASVLTAERKKKGKRLPEDLVSTDDIRNYKQVCHFEWATAQVHLVCNLGFLLKICVESCIFL